MTAFRSRAFHALAVDFRIESQEAEIGEYVAELFDAFAPGDDDRAVTYSIVCRDDDPRRYRVDLDDAGIVSTGSGSELASSVVSTINTAAIGIDYAVMLHAGAVARDGIVYVFPAHTESGKTTLTAGLVRAGFDYVSDEAVAIGWESGIVEPYPKPLSIDEGSQHLFAELRPARAPGDDGSTSGQWQVPIAAFGGPARVAPPARIGVIAFPAYATDASTELVPMTRADALVELARNTFQFRDQPRRALTLLADVVRAANCFRLPIGDLDAACALVDGLASARVAESTRG